MYPILMQRGVNFFYQIFYTFVNCFISGSIQKVTYATQIKGYNSLQYLCNIAIIYVDSHL